MIKLDKSLCFLINSFILKIYLVIFQLKTVNRTLNWLLWHCLFWDIWHIWETIWGSLIVQRHFSYVRRNMDICLMPPPRLHIHMVYEWPRPFVWHMSRHHVFYTDKYNFSCLLVGCRPQNLQLENSVYKYFSSVEFNWIEYFAIFKNVVVVRY